MSINYQQINLLKPNPFTFRPIPTDMTTNDLLLRDARERVRSRVAIVDIGLMEGSAYISPMHLQPGWKWK